MGHFSWEETSLTYLKEQWGQISASTIGRHLGIGKNAVIGKAHRLKLGKGFVITPKKPKKKEVKCRTKQIKRIPIPKSPRAFTVIKRGKCQWIEGDPVKFRTTDEGKCLKPTVYKENGERSAYCLKHTKIASRFVKEKEIKDAF